MTHDPQGTPIPLEDAPFPPRRAAALGDALRGGATTVGQALRDAVLEGVAWLGARPRQVNRIDQTLSNRFYETGPDLIDSLVGAIASGQHAALAGPRGCGKSYCVGEAIARAEAEGLLPRNGWIKVQGNKELPRDYLFEDDVALVVTQDDQVIPQRKSAPLFAFADRNETSKPVGRPIVGRDGLVKCYGRTSAGTIDRKAPRRPGQRIVLFLDEVNRFSDGVLDSLLLLLEEGEVVMAGDTYKLPVVVLMTMNPPGYDASARTLSPPLSARIARQYRLLSPRIDVLTDRIANEVLQRIVGPVAQDGLSTERVAVEPPPPALVRRAAAVTLAAWGTPPRNDAASAPGYDYLSRDMHALLWSIADSSPRIAAAMETLGTLCHFGPDGRALGDWIVAASVAARDEAAADRAPTSRTEPRHFVATAVTILSHKLQDNFSAASRPDSTRDKELAIQSLVTEVMEGDVPGLDDLLRRPVDDGTELAAIAAGLSEGTGPAAVGAVLMAKGATRAMDMRRWRAFVERLGPLRDGPVEAVGDTLQYALTEAGVVERTTDGFAVRSERDDGILRWIAPRLAVTEGNAAALSRCFGTIFDTLGNHGETLEDTVARHIFVSEGVWPGDEADLGVALSADGRTVLTRSQSTDLFRLLDDVWLRTEHVGLEVAEPLLRHLYALGGARGDDPAGPVAGALVTEVLGRMARDGSRGRRTRAVRRQVARALSAVRRPTVGDGGGSGPA